MIPTSRREQVEALQNELLSRATGGAGNPTLYRDLRLQLLEDSRISPYLPSFVRTCSGLDQFWAFIKQKFGGYADRREFIWDSFRPLFDLLDGIAASPNDALVQRSLGAFDREHLLAVWQKALERRASDPEGALTAARTLLESVCKQILDECGAPYPSDGDLPKLYRLVADHLQLAPSQHTEQVFRQILGGCQSVVEGLAAARNKLSDSHGQGRRPVKPAPRHAELAVNLAGSMAVFLVATHEARTNPAAER